MMPSNLAHARAAPSPSPLVWLASYPRSGNTLLRLVLEESFGLTTHSLYEGERDGDEPTIATEDLDRLRGGDQLCLLKTHGPPPAATDRAIYVVRDARAVLASYHAYLTDHHDGKVSIEEIIVGSEWPGDWSRHVAQWLDDSSCQTLIVRYEELAAGDPVTMARIAGFLDRPQLKPFSLDFGTLNSASPKFYRKGSNHHAVEQISRDHAALFELFHGEMMRRVGYALDVPPSFNARLRGEVAGAVATIRRTMNAIIAVIEADRAERLELIHVLDAKRERLIGNLVESEEDRAARLVVIDDLTAALASLAQTAEAERTRAEADITRLNAACSARDEIIATLSAQLREARAGGRETGPGRHDQA